MGRLRSRYPTTRMVRLYTMHLGMPQRHRAMHGQGRRLVSDDGRGRSVLGWKEGASQSTRSERCDGHRGSVSRPKEGRLGRLPSPRARDLLPRHGVRVTMSSGVSAWASASESGAGPRMTLPVKSYCEPWHGQMYLLAARFHGTTQPRWVHTTGS